MAKTLLESDEIGSIQRNDFDITTAGQAIITKIVAGTNVTISSTGVDMGTGDVTINASLTGGGGSGITRSINNISTSTTGGMTLNVDYVYLATGTITFTLPTAVGNTNRYTLKNIGTGTITIATMLGQTIDSGAAPITITRQNNSLDFISNGTNWFLI